MMIELPWLLLLVPALGTGLGLLAWRARTVRIRRAAAWSRALETAARARHRWAPAVLAAVGALVGLGLAGPRGGRRLVDTESRAMNLVIGIDISRSMLAEDVLPNRLQHAAGEASRLHQDFAGDRVGLLAFAGHSYILTPLTLDHGAAELYLSALDPDLASEGGTSLETVLRQGFDVLTAAGRGGGMALVIFTDGETHDSLEGALRAAADLRNAGVRLVLVGVGGAAPVRIPLRDDRGRLEGYQDDGEGKPVLTRREDGVLEAVARAAGGVFVGADLPNQSGAAAEALAALARRPVREQRAEDLQPLAWIAALGAALLLLGYTLARRAVTLVAVAGLAIALSAARAAAQRPSSGLAPARAGAFARAAESFATEAQQPGSPADTAWYNAGTAALRAGRYDEAREALDRAAASLDPALRYRALYNYGVAALLLARADTARRDSLERDAATRLKEALLLYPNSARAKWNLELAMHRNAPPPPSGGGGNTPPPTPPPPSGGGGGGGGGGTPPPKAGGLTQAEAEAILSSVERGEEAVREAQAKRRRLPSARPVKDW